MTKAKIIFITCHGLDLEHSVTETSSGWHKINGEGVQFDLLVRSI
ncbi:hypothetical protein [Vagococcus allomyrinae]|nr:hypothetical protein [Vagococcus allomyrinae]